MVRALPWKLGTLAVVVTLLVPARAALALTPTFNIEGVVTDAQQAVLPGVTVTISNTATWWATRGSASTPAEAPCCRAASSSSPSRIASDHDA